MLWFYQNVSYKIHSRQMKLTSPAILFLSKQFADARFFAVGLHTNQNKIDRVQFQ
jgi:hypothetical protein